jgi:hypothetical protein
MTEKEHHMGTIHKTMTAAAEAANQANSRQSHGPASPEGKEKSKMNATKHGKYAERPDPVELLLAEHSSTEAAEAEEGERDRLRAEIVRSYQPRDDFGRLQAEELADAKFELRRVERVKQALWQRERELLEIEQRRRVLRVRGGAMETTQEQVSESGLAGLPDSPGKFLEMRTLLQSVLREAAQEAVKVSTIESYVGTLYGTRRHAWRGWALRGACYDTHESRITDEAFEQVCVRLTDAAQADLDRVEEELAICLEEQGPLSPAGQAERLLEATSSRKWAWLRHQENFLRRSIDRKVRLLIDLRNQAAREAVETARSGDAPTPDAGNRDRESDPQGGGNSPAAASPAGEASSPPASGEAELAGSAPDGPAAHGSPGGSKPGKPGKTCENRGTNPLSPLKTVKVFRGRRGRIRLIPTLSRHAHQTRSSARATSA